MRTFRFVILLLLIITAAPLLAKEATTCRKPLPDKLLALGGTLVLSDPKESVALFRYRGGRGVVVKMGEPVGDRKYFVTSIDHQKVCVRKAKGEETLLVAAPGKTSGADRIKLGEVVGIRRGSETQFRVPRALLTKELSNMTSVLSSARAVPETQGGVFGYRLEMVEESSIIRTLGLQSGDVLRGANEIKFNGLADALLAYQVLMSADNVEIHLIRAGKPLTLKYDARP